MMPLAEKKSVVKKALGKVTNAVGSAMAYPWTLAANNAQKTADSEVNILKNARNGKGAPQFGSDGKPTEAFQYKTLADGVRQKYADKRKKISGMVKPVAPTQKETLGGSSTFDSAGSPTGAKTLQVAKADAPSGMSGLLKKRVSEFKNK